ncbi:MAG: M50 family metallopeptidase [Hyphomonadaceae bacterium]
MDTILWVLQYAPVFLILISVVITVHELGHYWVGRLFGAAAESFAIGFGRPIIERRDKRGTRWRINWIPLGGFVNFVGEVQLPQDVGKEAPQTALTQDEADKLATHSQRAETPAEKKTATLDDRVIVGRPFNELGPWQRIAVALGGPLANFVFAIVTFAAMGFALGVPQAQEVVVVGVVQGGPAEHAGFKTGDVVLEAGSRKVETRNDVIMVTQLSAGEAMNYKVRRGGETLVLTATPVENTVRDEQLRMSQKVGQLLVNLEQRDTSIRNLNPVDAVGYGLYRTGDTIGSTVNVMRRLLSGKEGLDKLSGPVGILHLTGGVTQMTLAQEGVSIGEKIRQLFWTLAQLAALLSVGIGFFNLLPFPILDGGTVVMTFAEAVRGKPLPDKFQYVGRAIGLVCLVAFAVVITMYDSLRLPWGG